MTTHAAFELTKNPCRIESLAFSKSKPKSDTDTGAGVKKMTIWIDITEKVAFSRVVPLFPGLLSDDTPALVASKDGPGFDVKGKKKLGTCVVKVHGQDDGVMFESPTARVGLPRVQMGKDAKTAWLILQVEMAVPKSSLGDLDDYFKADSYLSIAPSQLDLEDESKAKAKLKAKEKELAGSQVAWIDRAAPADAGEADA